MSGQVLRDIFDRHKTKKPVSPEQEARAEARKLSLSEEDGAAYDALVGQAKTPTEKEYLGKALSCGYPVWKLEAFADEIRGQSEEWLETHLRVTGTQIVEVDYEMTVNGTEVSETRLTGGLIQQFQMSCNATTTQAVKAELDPVFALQLNKDLEARGLALAELTLEETAATIQQKSWLESDRTATGGGKAGVAVKRLDPVQDHGRARMIPDLLNDPTVSSVTGLSYSFEPIPPGGMDKALVDMIADLAKGRPVPLRVFDAIDGNDGGAHFVMAVGSDDGPPPTILIYDPWTGETVPRTQEQIKNNDLNLPSGWNALAATYKAGKATALAIVANSITHGERAQARVTATSNAGQPAGDITLYVGSRAFVQPLSGGLADFDLGVLPAANYRIRAEFKSQGDWGGSTMAVLLPVAQAATTVTVAAPGRPSAAGAAVTFTASVAVTAPGAGTPVGWANFILDGADFGSAVKLSAGQATSVPIASLPPGNHTVDAEYIPEGDDFLGSITTSPATHIVNAGSGPALPPAVATTVSLSATVMPSSSYGESVAFTATVTWSGGTPTGSVNFQVDGNDLGGPVSLASGVATSIATTTLTAGDHRVAAVYSGTSHFEASSFTGDYSVDRAQTEVAITPRGPADPGEAITFTAAVRAMLPGSGTPTGLVQFRVGGIEVGKPVKLSAGTVVSGPISSLSGDADYGVTADYLGDSNFEKSASPQVVQTINGPATPAPFSTRTTVGASPSPSAPGQAITLTAIVFSQGGTPEGTVQFQVNGERLGAPVALADGKAFAPPIASLPSGLHDVSAVYSGAVSFSYSVGEEEHNVTGEITTVTPVATSTTVSSGATPSASIFGEAVTFTAAVAGGSGTPTGSVQFQVDGTALGAPVALTGLTATSPPADKLAAGAHTISAVYAGAIGFQASTGDLAHDVGPAGTTVAVTAPSSPSAVGQAVTFIAEVVGQVPGAGTPTGSVQFEVDGTAYGSAVKLSGGRATSAPVASLAAGDHAVKATFTPDSISFQASTSATAATHKVNAGQGPAPPVVQTTTTIAATVAPSKHGQEVKFAAKVTPVSGGPPLGSVQFLVDGAVLGAPVPLVGDTSTSDPFTTLPAGAHAIAAVYAGSAGFEASTGTLTHQVEAGPTETTVTLPVNPVESGRPVSFDVEVKAVAPAAGTPSGVVQFTIAGAPSGKAVVLAGGRAHSAPIGTLDSGKTFEIGAQYQGDANFTASVTTAPVILTVNKADTVTTVTAPGSPSVPGLPVSFRATVALQAPAVGTATGEVTFKVGTTVVGGPAKLAGGRAVSAPIASLPEGDHQITAEYLGDTYCKASTASAVTHTVSGSGGPAASPPAATTTAVTSGTTPSKSEFGQPVMFNATVTPTAGGSPTGSIQFRIDGVDLGRPAPLAGVTAASRPVAVMPVGAHTVTASYDGDIGFEASTGSLSHEIEQAGTRTTIMAWDNPVIDGDEGTVEASVVADPESARTPSGNVEFDDGGAIATVPLDGGRAIYTFLAAPPGRNVVAHYLGDAEFKSSSSSTLKIKILQSVTTRKTQTTVNTSSSPSVFGEAVTFTATVIGTPVPTGSVQFQIDGVDFGTAVTLNSSGTADITSSTGMKVGQRSVSAVFTSDQPTLFRKSSGSLPQDVNRAGTTTTVTTTAASSVPGQPVTFRARVQVTAPGAGTPSGTVQFRVDGEDYGAPVRLSGDTADSRPLSSLPVATHTITAVYMGDASFAASDGNTVSLAVTASPTTVTITPAANPSLVGQAVTFTAEVKAASPGAFFPTGTVQFQVDGIAEGSATKLVGGKAASAAVSTLLAGDRAITAVYSGDLNFQPQTGSLTQKVNRVATTIVATASGAGTAGQSFSFTAEVRAASDEAGPPTGDVQFKLNDTNIGTPVRLKDGKAVSDPVPIAMPGDYKVTADFLGGSAFEGSTSAPATQTVRPVPTTTVATAAGAGTAGQSFSFTAEVRAASDEAGPITGDVQFKLNGADSGNPVRLKDGKAASNPVPITLAGDYKVTAVFLGGGAFEGSTSAAATQTVRPVTTTTVVTASGAATAGQEFLFTAEVRAASDEAGPITGDVQFKLNGADSGAPVPLSKAGTAVSAPVKISVSGAHQVTAVFLGGGAFEGSTSAAATQTVRPVTTTTVVTASGAATAGQEFLFTAEVRAASDEAGPITGDVQFKLNGADSGAPVPLSKAGTAVSAPVKISVSGAHQVTAVFLGGGAFEGSTSAAATQTVRPVTTTTVVTASGAATAGQEFLFTAEVRAASDEAGPITGDVQFKLNGADSGAPVPLSKAGTAVSAPVKISVSGAHQVTAVFLGGGAFEGSTSAAATQTVRPVTTTTVVTASGAATAGQEFLFTAEVRAASDEAGPITGDVQFKLNGADSGAPVPLSKAGTAVSAPVKITAPGKYPVTAVFLGSGAFEGSTSAPATQTVNPRKK